MTITAQPGGSFVDADLSADLAAAALDLARRFHDGATLWVISPQWEPHAHHVAVEFVHPVIMGKRALPPVPPPGRGRAGGRGPGLRPTPAFCCGPSRRRTTRRWPTQGGAHPPGGC